jgi:rhodanese-related sulfurtransferase
MDTVSIDSRSLYDTLGSAQAPRILDVRREPAYQAEDRLVPGAQRPAGLSSLPRDRPIVVYCVRGHEVSQDAAAQLRSQGRDARYLEGGLEGWIASGFPTMRRRPEWRVPGGSRWITRERPKIDRIACPWLIRRFIDPLAAFDYVPKARVLEEASARNAVPYDIDGAVVTHRGERCSFDALLEDFALRDPALDRLATIVRGADTNRPDLAPESPQLLSTSMALAQRYADDHEMLEHAMPVYDALYARCRNG